MQMRKVVKDPQIRADPVTSTMNGRNETGAADYISMKTKV